MSGKPTDEVAEEVQEDSVEEVLVELKEELKQGLPEPTALTSEDKPTRDADGNVILDGLADMLGEPPTPTSREYRLELFEEGNNKVFARQRGLAREGWKSPTIHGFRRHAPSGLVADSFLVLVASRDVEVPADA